MTFRGKTGDGPSTGGNTLKSTDTFEVIAAVGEGPNAGLENGLKSLFAGDTPIVADDGEPNFKQWSVGEYLGTPAGHVIKPKLGGVSVPADAVNVALAYNTAVTRQGTQEHYDYMDVRLLINALIYQNSSGDQKSAKFRCKIEYRASDTAPWLAAALSDPSPTSYDVDPDTTPGAIIYDGGNSTAGDDVIVVAQTNRYILAASAPAAPTDTSKTWWWISHVGRPSWYDWGTDAWVLYTVTETATYWIHDSGGLNECTYYKPTSTFPSDYPSVGSTWIDTGFTDVYLFNGSAWVAANTGVTTPADILIPLVAGELEINERITSPTVFQFRFPVPDVGVPIDVRITRTTENDQDGVQCNVSWESFSEVTAGSHTWPNTHILHIIGRASDQLSGLPELTGVFLGRVVKVPTNYDEVTRTYSGIWDGTYKQAYTTNPAFCTQDFIENTRYGLSSLYPLTVKALSFYAWGQWCDVSVPDGRGGTRPRWTLNDTLDQQRNAREYVQYMAGSAGGRITDDGTGVVDVLIDQDEDACFLFGPENVVDGEFAYSFTDVQTRANWVKVGFINPDRNWAPDFRVITDEDHIAQYGRIPLEFAAVGKIDESEALASARQRLITSTTECTMVSFRTNRQGKYIVPFSVVLIADPDMGWGITGRIRSKVTARQVTLRDAITLEAGVTYVATFTRPTAPFTTARVNITNAAGTYTTLNFATDLPTDLPEFAQFALEAPNQAGLPKPFRVMSWAPVDGSSELVEVACLELNRDKWDYIDGNSDLLPVVDYSNFDGPVPKPAGVRTRVEHRAAGQVIQRALIITWATTTNPLHQRVVVEYSLNGGAYSTIGSSDSSYFEIPNVAAGVHNIRLHRVHAVNPAKVSPPVTVVHDVSGATRIVPPIASLALIDEVAPPAFEARSPKFTWAMGVTDASFSKFRVRILNGALSVVRTEDALVQEYIYDFVKQQTDGGGTPGRTFTIRVTKVDAFGNESTVVDLLVSNAAPAAPTGVTCTPTISGINVLWAGCTERDYAGTKVTIAGVTKYEGAGSSVFIPMAPGTYSVVVSHYDIFSTSGLNSTTVAGVIVASTVLTDTTPPANPTSIVGFSKPLNITITWVNPTDLDFKDVLVFRNTTNDSATSTAIGSSAGTAYSDATVVMGTVYYYWLKARDNTGNVNPAFATGPGPIAAARVRLGRDMSKTENGNIVTDAGLLEPEAWSTRLL
jgi:predicted phage tail protein